MASTNYKAANCRQVRNVILDKTNINSQFSLQTLSSPQIRHEGVRSPRDRGHSQHGGGRPHCQVQLGQGERRPEQHPHQCPGRYAGQ